MHESPPSAGSQPALAAPAQRRNAAFYAAPVEAFLAASDEEAYAPLAAPHIEFITAGKSDVEVGRPSDKSHSARHGRIETILDFRSSAERSQNIPRLSARLLPYCDPSKPGWHGRPQAPDDAQRQAALVGDILGWTEEGVWGGKPPGE